MRRLQFSLAASLSLSLLGAGGCGFFPNAGPESWEIHSGVSEIPYALVKLTPETIDVIAAHEPKGLAGAFTDKRGPKEIVFGIGDVVDVTVFEAAAGGLYIPLEAGVRPGNFVTFPAQIVDNHGNITIPYAGEIKAAGRTNVQIQKDIVEKIKNRAIEPQVIVSLEQQRSQLISVIGDVHAPLRFATPMAGAQDRVLDAITRAGGIASPGFATWVMLERDGKRATVPFENLVMNASNNIYIRPGDRIYVYTEPQKILAFGELGGGGGGSTAGAQAEIPFETWRMNLAEALGKAGGVLPSTADPAEVFIYRKEPREIAQLLGADMAKFDGPLVPVIFWINLRDPGGFFLSTRFQMRNDDILFVASAAAVETGKFLTYVGLVASTASSVMGSIQQVPVTAAFVRGHTFGATIVTTP
ncbi:MAG: polysaccharide export protein [Methylocapsa sp.]|nr:polysaccharide export protein [Methylocapsa sp.]